MDEPTSKRTYAALKDDYNCSVESNSCLTLAMLRGHVHVNVLTERSSHSMGNYVKIPDHFYFKPLWGHINVFSVKSVFSLRSYYSRDYRPA